MDALAGHLAANVKQLRTARGFTQQQMARLSSLPRATWANLESGSANPTLAVIHRVASSLQISLEELLARRARRLALLPAQYRAGARARPGERPATSARSHPGSEIARMEFARWRG